MLFQATLAVVEPDGSMSSWGRENLEAFRIAEDYGQSVIALVEQRSRTQPGIPILVLPVDREALARVLFP